MVAADVTVALRDPMGLPDTVAHLEGEAVGEGNTVELALRVVLGVEVAVPDPVPMVLLVGVPEL